jgi:hypothetical protein
MSNYLINRNGYIRGKVRMIAQQIGWCYEEINSPLRTSEKLINFSQRDVLTKLLKRFPTGASLVVEVGIFGLFSLLGCFPLFFRKVYE